MEPDVNIIYNVFHAPPLEFPIAIYFYLTGLSAGSFLLSTLAYGFGLKKFKPIGLLGVRMAIVLLILAPINLIVDLEQPMRFWHLFPYLNMKSPITYGTFLLSLYPLNAIIYSYFMGKGNMKMTKIFGFIGIPLAISVHGYTGFILALSKARALWNTALMPVLFLISAMVSGIAMMMIAIAIKQKYFAEDKHVHDDLIKDMGQILSVTIFFDLFLILCDLLVLQTADTEAHHSAMLILTGDFSLLFLWIEVVLGSLIPLIFLNIPAFKKKIGFAVTAAVLVMIGILAMRYVMVIGGQSIPLS
ncbi:MAG: polysulfide reductase NrfD [Candidatus Kapabacteria bacterium]|nr:polysulfide reductase NrfD [Candidatus Kapabacteria bacterium]